MKIIANFFEQLGIPTDATLSYKRRVAKAGQPIIDQFRAELVSQPGNYVAAPEMRIIEERADGIVIEYGLRAR